jgi:hypothetical protein
LACNWQAIQLYGQPMPILFPQLDPLFSQRSLTTLLKDQIRRMENSIDELSDDIFLQNSPEDLIETLAQDAYLPPLEIFPDRGEAYQPVEVSNLYPQAPVPVIGWRYGIGVPYTGASGLLNHQPARTDIDKPTAGIRSNGMQGTLVFTRVATTDVSEDQLKESFDAEIAKVHKYIGFQALQLDPFNASVKDEASRRVYDRRDRILRARRIAASLGYPLQQREGAPQTYVSPAVRRKVITSFPTTTYQPEPTIAEAEYQNILRIIENMSFVMERNPRVFSVAPEETIRDHYLVQLNGQYEGSATGETFNGNGKTDILVRDGNDNLFIAECKIWHGEKQFIEAVNQLLGYVTWRDTKTAIIIFNRNQATTPVVETIESVVSAHASYKRDLKKEGDTRLRAVFGKQGDPARDIIVTIIVVPIPKAQ